MHSTKTMSFQNIRCKPNDNGENQKRVNVMDNETLRKVQLVQLEIAKEIKRVCEENNITCWMEGGTLLGAVRHGGFIPWDDDLDLGMHREDYEKFLRIAPDALNEKYELVDWKTVRDYPNFFCKVMKKGTVYVEEMMSGSSKCGIWVDIFPYDNCPNEASARKRQIAQLTVLRAMIRAKTHWNSWYVRGKFVLKKWLVNLPFQIMAAFFTKEQLVYAYEQCTTQYNKTSCSNVFYHDPVFGGKWVMPKKIFAEFIQLPFEDDTLTSPVGYDTYLTRGYGDYMTPPPEDKRGNQHGIVKVEFGDQRENNSQ